MHSQLQLVAPYVTDIILSKQEFKCKYSQKSMPYFMLTNIRPLQVDSALFPCPAHILFTTCVPHGLIHYFIIGGTRQQMFVIVLMHTCVVCQIPKKTIWQSAEGECSFANSFSLYKPTRATSSFSVRHLKHSTCE